ncbi:MAG TPA: thymidylate synthase (FAD), partial [Chloroflexi bacterium]|nr:thymidylate synthase (FAD) [Chloroflexota bacterium]
LRSGHGTQKEHIIIADECKEIFVQEFPICAEALGY